MPCKLKTQNRLKRSREKTRRISPVSLRNASSAPLSGDWCSSATGAFWSRSGQAVEEGGYVGHRVDHVVGPARRPGQRLLAELARPYQHPADPRRLCAEHVGVDVITDHQRIRRRHPQSGEHSAEEGGGWLTYHGGRHACGLLESHDERPHVEPEPLGCLPVEIAMHGNERRSPNESSERPIKEVIGDLRSGPTG